MKNKILILAIVVALTANFTGCGKKGIQYNNLPATGQLNQLQENESITTQSNNSPVATQPSQSKENESKPTQNDLNSNKDNYNKFFFKGISLKNQYAYKGTVWGDNILDQSKGNMDSEGGVFVKANLTVSQIAKLNKGNIYELDFSVKGEKSNTEEKGEKVYLWVTEDKIFNLSPPSGTNVKDLYENGQFNYLKYAKKIEKSGLLPSADKRVVLCSNENMNFSDGVWETVITVKNNICTYSSTNKGNYSNAKFVWEENKGLTNYSWGQGARAAGMDLHLVE